MTIGKTRLLSLAAGLVLAAVSSGVPQAEEGKEQAQAQKIVVCDDLITLRRLMSAVPDQGAARDHLAEHPGCREVPASAIGEVESRTMFGGLPYECRKRESGACVWVLP